ncbi:hypothetical protein MCOR02_004086 [Pyricularia oryzae]|nr:hypothetical protein MCOR01_005899 [Pyricularia oryzae]KAH9435133.1 hypothetical protein MCOR02_004086 [Pyricularia oryzae]KAI6253601.1 hypothetical protein MCOR19_009836 [Pyricularia oryzae]KAI6264647.1 hypothetical protein MCOR26_011211 [Pyricularia oryzae]KAI6306544.1 hypothetical protein MCOR30_011753 [Pyricularia oryzae]
MCGSATTGTSGGGSSGSGRVWLSLVGEWSGVGFSFAFADQREATNSSQSRSFDFLGSLLFVVGGQGARPKPAPHHVVRPTDSLLHAGREWRRAAVVLVKIRAV